MIYALGIVMPSDTHNFSRGMRSLDPAKPFGTSTVAQAVHEDSLIRKYQVIYTYVFFWHPLSEQLCSDGDTLNAVWLLTAAPSSSMEP